MKNRENRTKSFIRLIKYTLIAASAGIIEFGVETLLTNVCGLKGNLWWISYTIALVLSVVWNFTINRKYTFKSANNVPIAMLKVIAYYLVFSPLSIFFGDYLVKIGVNEDVVTIINMIINFVTEFLYQRYFVFGKSIDTNNLANRDKKKEKYIIITKSNNKV